MKSPMMRLMRRIHEDEQGAVSLETILIVGAIALPILIFLIRVGWPRIRDLFDNSMTDLEGRVEDVNPKQ